MNSLIISWKWKINDLLPALPLVGRGFLTGFIRIRNGEWYLGLCDPGLQYTS